MPPHRPDGEVQQAGAMPNSTAMFRYGLAFAQAAEENERKGDLEKALALYIQATENFFAADPGDWTQKRH